MRKVYIDLAIVLVSLFLIIKYTMSFLAILVIGVLVWLLVINDDKKEMIKNKISSLYNK